MCLTAQMSERMTIQGYLFISSCFDMLSFNKVWSQIWPDCITEHLKVRPSFCDRQKCDLNEQTGSLWKLVTANTASCSRTVYELIQYFISTINPLLWEQGQQKGEEANKTSACWKDLFYKNTVFQSNEVAVQSIKISTFQYSNFKLCSLELSWSTSTLFHLEQLYV